MSAKHLIVAAAILAPALAAGEPATIRLFEAKAHAQPDEGSPVVHVFAEGARVSVSEAGEAGWRRIRLPDGATAFILESALAFAAPAAEAPAEAIPPPSPTSTSRPDLRPPIYVKDLEHFADLVKEDPELADGAASLERRRKQAVAGAVGLAAGVALTIGGVFKTMSDTNKDTSSPDFGRRSSNAGPVMWGAGLGLSIGSGIWFLVRQPKGKDLIDVVNRWNERHPDRPFTLEHGEAVGR